MTGIIRRIVALEIGMWRSLYRWIFRRPLGLETGAVPFAYTGAVIVLLYAFIGVSAIDVPVLHLILPWRSAQVVSLIVGVWGLLWMIGLLASLKVNPHGVGRSGLQVRYGVTVDLTIPWDAVATVSLRRRSPPTGRTIQLEPAGAGQILHVVMGSQTNVDVVLSRPLTVPLPKGATEITELRCYADDPDGLVALAREHLATRVATDD